MGAVYDPQARLSHRGQQLAVAGYFNARDNGSFALWRTSILLNANCCCITVKTYFITQDIIESRCLSRVMVFNAAIFVKRVMMYFAV